jgi:hypothetical protein
LPTPRRTRTFPSHNVHCLYTRTSEERRVHALADISPPHRAHAHNSHPSVTQCRSGRALRLLSGNDRARGPQLTTIDDAQPIGCGCACARALAADATEVHLRKIGRRLFRSRTFVGTPTLWTASLTLPNQPHSHSPPLATIPAVLLHHPATPGAATLPFLGPCSSPSHTMRQRWVRHTKQLPAAPCPRPWSRVALSTSPHGAARHLLSRCHAPR